MELSAAEAKRAIQKHYPNLLQLLPIDELVGRLLSRRLLSLDRKNNLNSFGSPRKKISYFLDGILVPGLDIGYTGHFVEMVIMMKESDDVLLKVLADKLMPDVSTSVSTAPSADTSHTNAGIIMKVLSEIWSDVPFKSFKS